MLRGTPVLTSALAEFEAYLQRKGLNAAEIVGVAADQRKAFPDMPLRTDNWRNYISEL
jgi:dihydroorotate dehydrogenase (NAD+) catalytic subunit